MSHRSRSFVSGHFQGQDVIANLNNEVRFICDVLSELRTDFDAFKDLINYQIAQLDEAMPHP